MKVLETERLILAKAELSDSQFFYDLLNSPTWIEHIGDRGIKKLEDAENYISNSLIKSYQENGYGLYKMMLKGNSKPIGICGLINRPQLDGPDIGFAILPEFEGNGYTGEAAKATLEYALSKLNLNKILAITTEANIRSQALLEKIGLVRKDKIKFENEDEELLLYSN